jgi:hypothetical protein
VPDMGGALVMLDARVSPPVVDTTWTYIGGGVWRDPSTALVGAGRGRQQPLPRLSPRRTTSGAAPWRSLCRGSGRSRHDGHV